MILLQLLDYRPSTFAVDLVDKITSYVWNRDLVGKEKWYSVKFTWDCFARSKHSTLSTYLGLIGSHCVHGRNCGYNISQRDMASVSGRTFIICNFCYMFDWLLYSILLICFCFPSFAEAVILQLFKHPHQVSRSSMLFLMFGLGEYSHFVNINGLGFF